MNNTEENNKLIAEFMSFKITEQLGYIEQSAHGVKGLEFYSRLNNGGRQGSWEDYKYMKFHSSWDWLMPVVEKIRETNFVFIFPDLIAINVDNTISSRKACKVEGCSIDSHYKAVVEFITWYNDYK